MQRADERAIRQSKQRSGPAPGGPQTLLLPEELRRAITRALEQHNADPRNVRVSYAQYARHLIQRALAELEGATIRAA
jgi:hypothetical protein